MPHKRPVRRGQLISPWGVGAMIDFPKDESLMTCGLDAWPFALKECPPEMRVDEERLQKRLGVSHFRLPPEFRDSGSEVQYLNLKVPFVRFPQWHYCPKCGSMEMLSIFGERQRCKGPNYMDGMSCHKTISYRRPWLIPVRFVAICRNSHIEDFPFEKWVHREKLYNDTHMLRLRAGRGTSTLSGIIIKCTCGEWRSMAGAFNPHSLNNVKSCSGHRPWLGEVEESKIFCEHELQVVQRGASNVYFSEIRSSIYLPRWENSIERSIVDILEKQWSYLTRGLVDGQLDVRRFETVAEFYSVDRKKLLDVATKKFESSSSDVLQQADSEEVYRKSEYDVMLSGRGGDNQDFFVTNKDARDYGTIVNKYFRSISLIHKLRETRAFAGFSRLLPEDGRSLQDKKSNLAISTQINWLPAIVVRGEGIFFEFDSIKLDQWAESQIVMVRAKTLIDNLNRARSNRLQSTRPLNPRFIFLHTFAHIVINQLSFECGYGSSAIRERIYCNTENSDETMNGVLIYTASGDSEGSLGGLVRQGNPDNLERIIVTTLHSAQWCSSDPVCIESRGQGPDSCNLATCHSCALLPETCCEEGNRLLDRVLVVGTLEKPETGYFYGFDENA